MISTGLDQLVKSRGLVQPDMLSRAQLVQAETGEPLGSVLTRLGFVSEQGLAQALSEATGLPIAEQEDYPLVRVEGAEVTPRFLRNAKAAPLRFGEGWVEVAFVDPLDGYPAQALSLAFNCVVRPVVGRPSDIESALDRAYGPDGGLPEDATSQVDQADLERLKDLASDAPAIRAVNRLITSAVEKRASDIHLEPSEGGLQVRMRVDGVMEEHASLPPVMKAAVVSRIKVMAGLNIAERRLPQDGRLRLAVRGHDVDLRVATSPTIHGEGVVLRLLDRSNLTLDFMVLGFGEDVLPKLRSVMAQPHGVLLVTGPTGSGKTTTLYAALAELNASTRKLLTIEDPIEYRLPGVNQTQVAPAIGLSFAAALRSFLRQDPDIMMVGEIRDLETAQVAVQAALTGHMILSTLHTNSASSAITRLLDMGVEPFLITSTLNGVLGQRLVRRLCLQCREPMTVEGRGLGLGDAGEGLRTVWRSCGCPACAGLGYRGRIAIVELLVLDEAISRLVLNRAEAQEIEATALKAGFRPMLQDGVAKIAEGLTTVEEVLRVIRDA